MDTIFSQPLVEKLGWMLVHFIWQGVVVVLLLALILRILRKHTANLRYIISCGALALMILAPVATILVITDSRGYEKNIDAEEPEPPLAINHDISELPAEELPVLAQLSHLGT